MIWFICFDFFVRSFACFFRRFSLLDCVQVANMHTIQINWMERFWLNDIFNPVAADECIPFNIRPNELESSYLFLFPFDKSKIIACKLVLHIKRLFFFWRHEFHSVRRKVPIGVCLHIHFGNMIINLRKKMASFVCPIAVILDISFEFLFFFLKQV